MLLAPLHPRNRGFCWQDHPGPFRRLRPEQVQHYDAEGYLVLEDCFDAPTLRALIAEIDPHEAQVEAFLRTREDGRLFIARAGEITFAPHLVLRSETLRGFCGGPLFQDLCHDLLGPDVRLYWDQAVYKKPGAGEPFPWHQDNGYTYVEPQQYLTCWVALSDATEENGCPWVLPGLHRFGTRLHRASELGWVCLENPGTAAVPAPVRAGGMVLFSSLTPHTTGPNRTGEVRKSYIVQFAPDGAVIHPDPASPGREAPAAIAADDPGRQFQILAAGRPLASA